MMNATSDRIGRLMVVVGGIATTVALTVPAIGRVVCFGLNDSSCTTDGPGVVLLAALFTALVGALVVMMIRGGSIWLLLGAIGALAVAINSAIDIPGMTSREELLPILGEIFIAVGGIVLALGAGIRLMARRARNSAF